MGSIRVSRFDREGQCQHTDSEAMLSGQRIDSCVQLYAVVQGIGTQRGSGSLKKRVRWNVATAVAGRWVPDDAAEGANVSCKK